MLCTIVPYITNLNQTLAVVIINIIIFIKRVIKFLSFRFVLSDYSLHIIPIFHLNVT